MQISIFLSLSDYFKFIYFKEILFFKLHFSIKISSISNFLKLLQIFEVQNSNFSQSTHFDLNYVGNFNFQSNLLLKMGVNFQNNVRDLTMTFKVIVKVKCKVIVNISDKCRIERRKKSIIGFHY